MGGDGFAPVGTHCDNAAMWWLAHGEHEVPAGADWLSPREQAILATVRYTKRRVEFLTRRWTAKRAVAMVLDRDLAPAALASVEIRHHVSGTDGWSPLLVTGQDGASFPGWWRRDGVFLLTVAGSEPSSPPVRLSGGGNLAAALPVHSWLAQPLA